MSIRAAKSFLAPVLLNILLGPSMKREQLAGDEHLHGFITEQDFDQAGDRGVLRALPHETRYLSRPRLAIRERPRGSTDRGAAGVGHPLAMALALLAQRVSVTEP
jgi:hypothetical protein